MSSPPASGVVVVDKPAGMTSHDVVSRIRRLAGTRKVGHAGTLDPMATGVLLVGVNRATRLLGQLSLTQKSYQATVRLGEQTTTDDAEGDILARTDAGAVSPAAVEAALAAFRGEILQVPATVSAIKVAGRRAHARVRAGEEVHLPARPVRIDRLKLGEVRPGAGVMDLDLEVTCSSGTYVRALARDLGTALSVGGHLIRLRRTAVGRFGVQEAHTLVALAEQFRLVPLAEVARREFASRELTADQAARVRHGQRLAATELALDGLSAVFAPDGEFLALYEPAGEVSRPVAVFTG